MKKYKPARSKEPIQSGQDDDPIAVLRSHPDFPKTLSAELEGVLVHMNPAWPEETIKLFLSKLDPSCHTAPPYFSKERVGKQDGLTVYVFYVRPGQLQRA